MRERACSVPGCEKSWVVGNPPLCSTHRERRRRTGSVDLPEHPPCAAQYCTKPGRINGLCQLHWHRLKSTGSIDGVPKGRPNHAGYLRVSCLGHILGKQIAQHQWVLFDKVGYGPHRCHWCNRHINWKFTGDDRLETDHLDRDRTNNNPSNLVPSCHLCNIRRAIKTTRAQRAARDAARNVAQKSDR